MNLKITIEHAKDATNVKKRVMWSSLETSIKGMEKISSVCELDEECKLGKEITKLVEHLIEKTKQKPFKDYILKLHIQELAKKSPKVKRAMAVKLMLKDSVVNDYFEMHTDSVLDKEFVELSTNLLVAKTAELKEQRKQIIKNKKIVGRKK